MSMVKAAREIGWSVIVSCNEEAPETVDTFVADFAVGMGVGQFMGGSLRAAENFEKYNRLLEISRADNTLQFAGPAFRR
jgi:enolase